MTFAVGQCWATQAATGPGRRLVTIGAIAVFEGGQRIICCSVEPDVGSAVDGGDAIAFLPLSEEAFAASVAVRTGDREPIAGFAAQLAAWQGDPRGGRYFTVPFDGSLERTIARQMAAIVEQS
jgi:hypothetical protein